ncbi:hypothetical protein [Streptomyces sp. NPDC050504]|uniref:hypothetical protein n=1 Tax=Streptomyces sp. NPDC050504 TaxID=3365618 RepID=UPI0037BAA4A3
MSTVLIVVALVVVFVAVVVAVLYARPGTSKGLRRRFGPEYDREVARHDGDAKAAEQALNERLRRHGSLRQRPLPPEAREQYVARWAGLQERFVDAPRQAVADADRLLAALAGDRGYPAGEEQYEERIAALSVHHPQYVAGARRAHRAALADGAAGPADAAGAAGAAGNVGTTEELRGALVDARALFEALVKAGPEDTGRRGARTRQGHGPRALGPRRGAKGSEA